MPGPRIYFAGSIRGGRADRRLYLRLIGLLQEYGDVLTEHIGDDQLTETGESGLTDSEIFHRDLDWLRSAAVFIAEVTTPSLGVGYEVATAEGLGIPLLCLHRDEPGVHLSAMIAGNDKFSNRTYQSWEEIPALVDDFFVSLGIAKTGPGNRPHSGD